jgi:hypothetical protein
MLIISYLHYNKLPSSFVKKYKKHEKKAPNPTALEAKCGGAENF